MSKRYEDEIRDLLKGMDRFPGEGDRARRRPATPSLVARLIADPKRLMGGALLLTLCAWVINGPWSRSYPLLVALSGWTQLIGLVLFVVAFTLLYRQGALGRMSTYGTRPQRWRGNVIEMPSRRGALSEMFATLRRWWRRATSPRTPRSRW
jgi:hypothetical protein